MILMKRGLWDEVKRVREVYYRIKILRNSGRDHVYVPPPSAGDG